VLALPGAEFDECRNGIGRPDIDRKAIAFLGAGGFRLSPRGAQRCDSFVRRPAALADAGIFGEAVEVLRADLDANALAQLAGLLAREAALLA